MWSTNIAGLQIPAAGPVFVIVLIVHILAAITSLVAALVAGSARKGPGRHPRAGLVYLGSLGIVFVTAAAMAAIRWPRDTYLLAIAIVAFGLGLYGWRCRRRHRPGWETGHAIGMGGSCIALFTGFYVDNGPQLPLWKLLPHWTYWILPTAVGAPLIFRALRRFHAGLSTPRRRDEPSARSPGQLGTRVHR